MIYYLHIIDDDIWGSERRGMYTELVSFRAGSESTSI